MGLHRMSHKQKRLLKIASRKKMLMVNVSLAKRSPNGCKWETVGNQTRERHLELTGGYQPQLGHNCVAIAELLH